MNSPVSLETYTEKPAITISPRRGRSLIVAVGVVSAALVLAWCVSLLQVGRDVEKGVLLTAFVFGAILAGAAGAYLLRERRLTDPGKLGLLIATACSVLLLTSYFVSV